jgi:3-(3-hydroxy-phenyl)propionate hydroxylase
MDVDVLIVGYGPVGAALAGLLGRYGVRTLVVDKATDIFAAPRAIALDNEALRILQQVGLDERAFDRVPIPYVAMRNPHFGEFARINTTKTIDGHPALVTFFQPDLERALRANAAQMPSVQVRTGVEFIGLSEERGGVRARLRTAQGAGESVFARYLVGADGANSHVRTAAGLRFEGKTYAEDWLIVDALDVPNPINHVEFLCDPARPGPHMVAPGRRTRWEFMLHPGESREAMLEDAVIAELLRPWGAPGEYTVERKAVYRFHARVCSRFSKGRIFLAGDAAHITPPFAGQGLVSGLRDAANLAWKLAWAIEGRAAASILDSYDVERRPHATKMIDLARRAGFVITPRSHRRAWVTHGTIKLLRTLPAFRSLIDDLGLKPANSYDRGLFIAGRGAVPRGSWFPQGVVRDAVGRSHLSDQVLGDGLSLVCAPSAMSFIERETLRQWQAAGGTVTPLLAKGRAPVHGAFEDVDGTFSAIVSSGACVVVRPDRTVLHDGPSADVNRVLRESLDLLVGKAPVSWPFHRLFTVTKGGPNAPSSV